MSLICCFFLPRDLSENEFSLWTQVLSQMVVCNTIHFIQLLVTFLIWWFQFTCNMLPYQVISPLSLSVFTLRHNVILNMYLQCQKRPMPQNVTMIIFWHVAILIRKISWKLFTIVWSSLKTLHKYWYLICNLLCGNFITARTVLLRNSLLIMSIYMMFITKCWFLGGDRL